MSTKTFASFVVAAVAMIVVSLPVNTLCAASRDPAPPAGGEDAADSTVNVDRETALLRMRSLEETPLLDADSQLFTVDGTYWIRHRGESRFHPATVLRLPRDGHEGDEPIIEGPMAEWLLSGSSNDRQLVPTPETTSSGGSCPYFGGETSAEPSESGMISPDDFPPLHPDHESWIDAVPDDQVIFHDAFEDGFPGTDWLAYDGDPGFGDDYWDDVDCHSHYGERSVWCAGHGLQESCTTRYWGMESKMKINPLVRIGDHTDVRLTYWSWQETDTFYLFFNLHCWISEDGYNWVFGELHYFDPPNVWIESTVDVSDFSTTGYLGVEFAYYNGSPPSIPNAGAYVDDFLVFGCPILGQTNLTTPQNGAYLCADEGEWWCWDPVPGASSYDVQWDDSPAFLSPEQVQATGTCFHRSLPAGVYWWRAAPRSSCSGGTWSTPRQVFVVEGPDSPWLTSPSAGASVFSGLPQIYTWDPTANASQYTVQWDNDPSFADPVAEQDASSTQVIQTLYGTGQWYWRARGGNIACDGPWSTPRSMNLIDNTDLIFYDGFESGSLAAWSTFTP